MSVFTPLSEQDIQQFLQGFELGALHHFQGIEGGSENTNYFVTCHDSQDVQTEYVLTLVERGPVQDLRFFIELLDCLQRDGLPVPYAIRDRGGARMHQLKGKPALLQPRLPGRHPNAVTEAQCVALAGFLTRMHGVEGVGGIPPTRSGPTRKDDVECQLTRQADRGPQWVVEQALVLLDSCWQTETRWLEPLLSDLEGWLDSQPRLPTCIIHGDLFRDNALFQGDELTGVIDFYNAATGWPVLELAICVNDWCVDLGDDGRVTLNQARMSALLDAYQTHRRLDGAELAAWPRVLQLAALRFWVSRQQYALQHRDQA